jgi:trans-aconitate 2-methyltransferase
VAPTWDPGQYLKFQGERTRPSRDLARAVEMTDVSTIIDVGCGPGNSTAVLRERWPDARIVGIDSSPEMIARAQREYPGGEWRVTDMHSLGGETYDLVFSNAALQWVPDQAAVLPVLLAAVAEGGALAVQVPANTDSPLYRAIIAATNDARWNDRMASAREAVGYRDVAFYYDALVASCARLEVWESIYHHALADQRSLVEWYKGTGMRPFLERLDSDAERTAFEDEILDLAAEHYPARRDGKILFEFRRIFFIAYR